MRIRPISSCRLERCLAPAEETTFSSSMIEPRSSTPMCSDELADVLAGGQPGRLQVGDVVEEEPGDRDHPQVLQDGRLGAALEVVVLRLVRPRDEGPEAAGAVLHVADHPQVLDALGVGLAGAHHHGGGRLDAQPVRDLHDLQPALARLLERRDRLARPRRAASRRRRRRTSPGRPP